MRNDPLPDAEVLAVTQAQAKKKIVRYGAQVRIIPIEEISGAWPDCRHCTWTCAGHGLFRLRYVNRACPQHGEVECG